MVKIYDLKSKKAVSLPDKEALNHLILDNERFAPLFDHKYMVVDELSGEAQKIKGQDLLSSLGSGKVLTDVDSYSIQKQLQAENSQGGAFMKSLASEALTLGLVKDRPENPWEQQVEVEYQKLFGRASKAGEITGSIAPFVAGGVAGLVKTGAKGVIKTATKKGLAAAGKAPSAAVLRGTLKASEKVGEQAAKFAGKAGAGPLGTKAAKFVGTGLTFAGATAAVEGVKKVADLTIESRMKSLPGGKKAHYQMSQVLGEGVKTASEVFTSTAIFMGGLGAAGVAFQGIGKATSFVGKGVGKLGGAISEKARGSFLGTAGHSFFNNRHAQRTIDGLRRSFGMKKEAPASEILKRTSDYIQGVFGKIPKNKREAIDLLRTRQQAFGKTLGAARDKMPIGLGQMETLKALSSLKKLVNPIEAKTTLKGFISTIDKLINQVGSVKANNFKFKSVKQVLNILSDKAKHQKGALPTDINKVFRKAYAQMTKFENQLERTVLKGTKTKVFTLEKTKKEYERMTSILSSLDKGIKVGYGVGNYHPIKDLLLAAGAGGVGGAFGGPAGAVVLGLGVAGGMSYIKATGARLLHVANFVDKARLMFSKVKTPGGIRQILAIPLDHKRVSAKTLGMMFFGEETPNMVKFDEKLSQLDEIDKVSNGQEDLFETVDAYGGGLNSQAFNGKMMQMKRFVMSEKPKPWVNPNTGKSQYSKVEVDQFYRNMTNVLSPEGFIGALKTGELSRKQFQMFSQLYPSFLSEMIVSINEGLSTGKIERTAALEHFLHISRPPQNDFSSMMFYNLDQMERDSNEGGGGSSRKIKPNQRQTISNRATGGVFVMNNKVVEELAKICRDYQLEELKVVDGGQVIMTRKSLEIVTRELDVKIEEIKMSQELSKTMRTKGR